MLIETSALITVLTADCTKDTVEEQNDEKDIPNLLNGSPQTKVRFQNAHGTQRYNRFIYLKTIKS